MWGARAPAERPDFRRAKKRQANEAQVHYAPWPMLPALGLAVGNVPTTSPRWGPDLGGGGDSSGNRLFFFFGNRQRQFNVHPSPHIHILRTLCNACSRCEEIVAQIPFLRVIDGEGRHPASPLLATRWHFRPANLSDWALPPGRHLVAMYFPIVG